MTVHAGTTIDGIVTQLARLDVRTWHGLPADVACRGTDVDMPAASMLGGAFEPAGVVSLDTPPMATGARAWLRAGCVVLVDVSLDAGDDAPSPPDYLGAPERRLDVTYGLHHIASGEWLYLTRGLAFVVADDRVRHVMGFVPCDEREYEARLRVSFATTRRPLDMRQAKEGL